LAADRERDLSKATTGGDSRTADQGTEPVTDRFLFNRTGAAPVNMSTVSFFSPSSAPALMALKDATTTATR
jgi:hypothetical protein